MLGMLLHEASDAELLVVEGVDQLANPANPFLECRDPSSKLCGADIILFQTFHHSVTRSNPHLEREINAGGVNGVDETQGIANQDPTIPMLCLVM